MSNEQHTHTEAPAQTGITVSDLDAKKLKEILTSEGKGPEYGLRLGIQGGGCSGMSYFMDFDKEKEDDKVFTHEGEGVKVLVDPRSAIYLSGSILDYNEGLMGSGFAIKNPNATGGCGCGKSFTV